MEGNLFKALVTQRRWVFEGFQSQFEQAARDLAAEERDPRIGTLTVAERTFRNWTSGRVKTLPQPDQCRVLERLFGHPAEELFGKAPAGASLSTSGDSGLILLGREARATRQPPGLSLKG